MEQDLPNRSKASEVGSTSARDTRRLIAGALPVEQHEDQPGQPEHLSSHLHTDGWRIVRIDFCAAPAHFVVRAEVIAFLVGNRCSDVLCPTTHDRLIWEDGELVSYRWEATVKPHEADTLETELRALLQREGIVHSDDEVVVF